MAKRQKKKGTPLKDVLAEIDHDVMQGKVPEHYKAIHDTIRRMVLAPRQARWN